MAPASDGVVAPLEVKKPTGSKSCCLRAGTSIRSDSHIHSFPRLISLITMSLASTFVSRKPLLSVNHKSLADNKTAIRKEGVKKLKSDYSRSIKSVSIWIPVVASFGDAGVVYGSDEIALFACG